MKNLSSQGISNLVRPTYSPGLLLEDEDLTAAVDYTRNLTRLLFRSLFGCGVICGLKVTAEPICKGKQLAIKVSRGLGLDCSGNPIEVSKDVTLVFDPECDAFPKKIWVAACHTCEPCRKRDVACSCDDDPQSVKTRMYDGYKIMLHLEPPKDVCMCDRDKHDDDSECNCGDCSCILIAEIELTETGAVLTKADVKTDNVRRLRPALMYPCARQAQAGAS